jgi:hypothetical protein
MSGVGKSKSQLREAAMASLAAGVGLEPLYAALLNLVPPEDRELVGRTLNLDRAYTAFVRRTGDAIRWLFEQQNTTNEPIDSRESEIVKDAARKFRVTPEAIERGFEGVQSKQAAYLKSRGLAVKRFV